MSSSHRNALGLLNQPSYHSHSMTHSSSHSPVGKMPQPQRTASQDSGTESIRKRVCKACDRCRLKKSKCDGSNPCTRCKQDNAICVFGERKKSHDKIYPKGYVEMLEQQQGQLVSGLQEMYKQLIAAKAWTGATLSETNGNPLTHNILAELGLLENKTDGSGEPETFEEDTEKLQERLVAAGAGYTNQRRGSVSSESDHSQHSHARSQSHGTPTLSKPTSMFKQEFGFSSAASSPAAAHNSAAPLQQRQSFPTAHQSPLNHSSPPVENDPQLFQNGWGHSTQDQKFTMQDYPLQAPDLDQGLGLMGMSEYDQYPQTSSAPYDLSLNSLTYPQMASGFGSVPRLQDGMLNPYTFDAMQVDSDFLTFAQMQAPQPA